MKQKAFLKEKKKTQKNTPKLTPKMTPDSTPCFTTCQEKHISHIRFYHQTRRNIYRTGISCGAVKCRLIPFIKQIIFLQFMSWKLTEKTWFYLSLSWLSAIG
jgi:hypothetical protein